MVLEAFQLSDSELYMEIFEVRRSNLRTIMKTETETATALSKRLGHKHPSFLSQLAGPNPSREITEKVAREFEAKLGLTPGYLDQKEASSAGSVEHGPADLVAAVVRLAGAVCASEKVQLSMEKFADLVALVFSDANEHDGLPREAHTKQLVRLLK